MKLTLAPLILALAVTACNPNPTPRPKQPQTASDAAGFDGLNEQTQADALENPEQVLLGEIQKYGGNLSAEDKAALNAKAKQLAKLIQQANTQDSEPDDVAVALSMEYQYIAHAAHESNSPYLNRPELKKLYEMLKRNAPSLNIQAVGESKIVSDNFVHVLIIDDSTNEPHFATYSKSGGYLLFPKLRWGSSFFNADGTPMRDNAKRQGVVADFVAHLRTVQEAPERKHKLERNPPFLYTANFHDRSHDRLYYPHRAYLLSDLYCANCLKAEFMAAAYAYNDDVALNQGNMPEAMRRADRPFTPPARPADSHSAKQMQDIWALVNQNKKNMDMGLQLWTAFVPRYATPFNTDLGLGAQDERSPRPPMLGATNCNTGVHLNFSYTWHDDGLRRQWNIGKDTSKGTDALVAECARTVYKAKALTMLYGIHTDDLPLLVSDKGLQMSGQFGASEFNEFLWEAAK